MAQIAKITVRKRTRKDGKAKGVAKRKPVKMNKSNTNKSTKAAKTVKKKVVKKRR